MGAFVGERLFGEATTSPMPWIAYSGLSVFGGCLLATLVTYLFESGEIPEPEIIDEVVQPLRMGARHAKLVVSGIAIGCAIAGVAIGASARVRPILGAALGGALGVVVFFAFARTGMQREALTFLGLAGVGGVTTAVASEIGWAVTGKRAAA
jgi:hypothetical protein